MYSFVLKFLLVEHFDMFLVGERDVA